METGPQVGQSWVSNTFSSCTHKIGMKTMHVSDWPKSPTMIPKPNLGGDFIFLHHSPLSRGILPCAHTPINIYL